MNVDELEANTSGMGRRPGNGRPGRGLGGTEGKRNGRGLRRNRRAGMPGTSSAAWHRAGLPPRGLTLGAPVSLVEATAGRNLRRRRPRRREVLV